MTPVRMFAAAVTLVIAVATVGAADAQHQAPQDQPGSMMGQHGMMMGNGAMGSGMMMGPGGMGAGMMGGSGAAMCDAMAGHIEGRLAYLKAELRITEAQEPLWTAFAAAERDNSNTMLAHCTAAMSQHANGSASLPDRLDQHEQFMAAHLEALRARDKALKPLYAALSDSQKAAADQLFSGPMGMMGMM